DSGEPFREHGLARARRAEQRQVMAAGGADLRGPARDGLAEHVGQVGSGKRPPARGEGRPHPDFAPVPGGPTGGGSGASIARALPPAPAARSPRSHASGSARSAAPAPRTPGTRPAPATFAWATTTLAKPAPAAAAIAGKIASDRA